MIGPKESEKKLRYFAIEKGDEKHLIRYYDDDLADVARQLQALARSDEYKFDHFDCIRSIMKLCLEHQERKQNESSNQE